MKYLGTYTTKLGKLMKYLTKTEKSKNKNAPLRKDFTYCKWVTKGSVTGPKTLSDLDDVLWCFVQYYPKNENIVFDF